MAWSLQTALSTLDHSEIILTEDDAEHVCSHMKAFLLHWQGMNQVYSEAGIARWKFRPKFHYFEEMMIQMRRTRVNPRHLACWVDEGYLGHIKKIAIHTHANTALLRIFQRLMINLSQRFHNTKELAKEVERLGVLKKEPQKKYDHLPL